MNICAVEHGKATRGCPHSLDDHVLSITGKIRCIVVDRDMWGRPHVCDCVDRISSTTVRRQAQTAEMRHDVACRNLGGRR